MGADTVSKTKRDRIAKYGEVFTPQRTVDQMCDLLQQENPDCFAPETTFLEPTCGEGVFVLEILRRKFRNCRARKDFTIALRSVYAMEIQADNVEITIRNVTALCGDFFRLNEEEKQIIRDHVIQADSLKIMRMINDMNGWEPGRPVCTKYDIRRDAETP